MPRPYRLHKIYFETIKYDKIIKIMKLYSFKKNLQHICNYVTIKCFAKKFYFIFFMFVF